MAKYPVEGRPYCQECHQKQRKEIAEAYTIVRTHAIKRAQKMGLPESEIVGIQEEIQRKFQVALHELDRQCRGNSM